MLKFTKMSVDFDVLADPKYAAYLCHETRCVDTTSYLRFATRAVESLFPIGRWRDCDRGQDAYPPDLTDPTSIAIKKGLLEKAASL